MRMARRSSGGSSGGGKEPEDSFNYRHNTCTSKTYELNRVTHGNIIKHGNGVSKRAVNRVYAYFNESLAHSKWHERKHL